MFRSFFFDKRWWLWSLLGSLVILAVTYYKVQLDVQINEWFGEFYNTLADSLAKPGSITLDQYLSVCWQFAKIAGIYIVILVCLDFFIKHYVFRWRTAMNDFYIAHWPKIHKIEGAAQRVQEDTMRFARIMEDLGTSFLRSVMTLFAFLPLLWELSSHVKALPWIGEVNHALIYLAILSAAFSTVVLALVGIKLPGLEFNNQKVEAAYRKALVYGEDAPDTMTPPHTSTYFNAVRQNYFKLYFHYLYFNLVKHSYLQFSVIVPYIAMGPTIVAGGITLGIVQRIVSAFNNVEYSFQYLVHSWSTIVELISIYKRLRAFEREIWQTNLNSA